MIRDVPVDVHEWQIVMAEIFEINQAFSRIFSAGASIAIIFWSVSALPNGGLGRRVAIYGCVGAALIIVCVGIGHWRLDVHRMTVIMVGQVIWYIVVGCELCSRPGSGIVPQRD